MADEKLGVEFLAKVAGLAKLGDAARKIQNLKKTSNNALGAFEKLNMSLQKVGNMGTGMKNWGGRMMMQTGLVYQAAQNLSRKFNTVVDAFTSVETKGKELGMVLAPMGGSINKSINLATQSAFDFSKKFSTSATEIMEAQYLIASAGISKPLITTKAAEWTIKLARATREGVASAANIWANAANTFFDAGRMTESEMRRLSDTLTRTQQKFQFENLFQLGDGINYAGAAARTMNISIESTATLLGVLNTSGIQGTMAGTSLQQTFLRLNKIQKKVGLQFKDTSDGGLDVIDVFEQLKAKTEGMTNSAKTLYLQTLFGDRAFKAVATIIDKLDQVKEDLIDVSSAAGVTQKSFEDMENTTAAAFAKLRNNFFYLFNVIGSQLGPSLVKLSKIAVKSIDKISAFIKLHPMIGKLVGGFFGIGAAIAGIGIPLMTFIGIFAWGAGSIISLVGGISGALAAVGPILAGIGIALVVIAQLAATAFIAWRIGKWLSKLEIGGKTLREWIRHFLEITIFSEAFRKIIDKIVKKLKEIAPPAAFAAAIALATPILISIAAILAYISSLVAVAFSVYKIGKWLGELKLGSRTLGEWVPKLLGILIFIERIKLAIIKLVGKFVFTNIKTIMDKLILTARVVAILLDCIFTDLRLQIIGAFTFWKAWIDIVIGALQTGFNNLAKWFRPLLVIIMFGHKIKDIFTTILDIVLKLTAPLRRLAQLRIIKPIQEEIKKTKIIEIIKSAHGSPITGGSVLGKIIEDIKKALAGVDVPSATDVGVSSPANITATRPEINNYYYTQHFEKGSVEIISAKLTPEKFLTLLEEVIRRKSLVNEPA